MSVQNCANSVISDANSGHARFDTMMKAAKAKQLIQEAYAKGAVR